MSRRRLGGWDMTDPNYNYGDMRDVIAKAKMMQSITLDPDTGKRVYHWEEGKYASWASKDTDYIGTRFEPFGGNNYLYGFPLSAGPLETYRRVHDKTHKYNKVWVTERANYYKEMRRAGYSPGSVADVVAYGAHKQNPNLYVLVACDEVVLDFAGRVFLLHLYLDWQSRFLLSATASTYYTFPALVAAQLYTLGWKRTLLTWGAGVLLTEGISYAQQGRFAGWSVITYMIYGQFWEEVYRVRPGFFKPMGFVTNSVGIYGLYSAGESFLKDSAPFLAPGPKTGVHHGAHHIGLILGFLLNRWAH